MYRNVSPWTSLYMLLCWNNTLEAFQNYMHWGQWSSELQNSFLLSAYQTVAKSAGWVYSFSWCTSDFPSVLGCQVYPPMDWLCKWTSSLVARGFPQSWVALSFSFGACLPSIIIWKEKKIWVIHVLNVLYHSYRTPSIGTIVWTQIQPSPALKSMHIGEFLLQVLFGPGLDLISILGNSPLVCSFQLQSNSETDICGRTSTHFHWIKMALFNVM